MSNKHTYNRKLKPFARALRKDSTPSEIILWNKLLKARGFNGYQFNRQLPVGPYIVDFACRKLKLVIEVDGYSHDFKADEDKMRDEYLNKLGYAVIRISEKEVRYDFDNVVRQLEGFLEVIAEDEI
jgi:very-short-patch-repair endonuclease